MSRSGDEMVVELSNLLNKNNSLDKTAAKKEKEEKCKECDKDPCKCKEMKEKEEKKEEKAKEKEEKAKEKKKKKAEFMSSVLTNLVKLAEQLDEAGADEAASLVDDALKVIVKNLKEEK